MIAALSKPVRIIVVTMEYVLKVVVFAKILSLEKAVILIKLNSL